MLTVCYGEWLLKWIYFVVLNRPTYPSLSCQIVKERNMRSQTNGVCPNAIIDTYFSLLVAPVPAAGLYKQVFRLKHLIFQSSP